MIIDLIGVTGRHQIQTAQTLLGREVEDGSKEIRSFREWVDDPEMYAEQRLPSDGSTIEIKGHLGESFTQRARSVDLIDRSRLAWTQVDLSAFSISAGEQGQVVITEAGDGTYRVTQYDGRAGVKRELGAGFDIGYAQGVAETFVMEAGATALADPNARWRRSKAKATDKQLAALERWRIPHDPDITKVAASELLDAAIATANLKRRSWNPGVRDVG